MSMVWLSGRIARKRIPPEIPLNDVRVASPCRAHWEEILGDNHVRHCAVCNLNVYNLSEMTRREAEELIVNGEGA